MCLRRRFLGPLPLLLGACTMVGAPGDPTGPPATAPTPSSGATPTAVVTAELRDAPSTARETSALAAQVVGVALESIGTPYVWGGTGDDGFDCSGLIQYAYAQSGILLPRVSWAQIRAGSAVPPDPRLLREADVLGFSDGRSRATNHVGLYVGGGKFIHSSSSGVRISSLGNRYWRERLVAARRIVD